MKNTWPSCLQCGIVTADLTDGRCTDPRRCVVVTLQRAEVLGEALAKVSRRLFGATPQEEFELQVVANA